jgi:Pentapeptide repeats (8 copies)
VANDEHVAMLRKGVDAWNAWRHESPDILPDLRGADLSEANLSTADLSDANLIQTNLNGALRFSERTVAIKHIQRSFASW